MKYYESYKESRLDWVDKIPSKWSLLKIGRTFNNIGSGTTPKSTNHKFYENGTINWLNTGDLNDSYINSTSKKITLNALETNSTLKIHPSDSIVIALYGATIGKLGHLKIKTTTNQACCVLSNAEKVEQRFLFYYFLAAREFIISKSYGGGQPNISQDLIKQLYIPSPSILEQIQITTYLDYKTSLIDALIEKKELLIQKLKEQRQAIINESVTKGLNPNTPLKDSGIAWLGEIPEHWEVVKFRYKFETNKGLTITKDNLQDKGVPCVNYGEIHSKYGFEVNPEIHNLKYVSEEYLETNESSLLSKGDFVFADTSEDIKGSGNFTHLNSDIPTFAGYHTIIARLIDKSDYRFFAYFFDSSIYRTQIQNLVKGVKVYSITNKILKDSNLLCPPLEEQRTISEYLDIKIGKLFISIEKLVKSIQKLKSYRQSIISEAVTGKIDVRDWQAKKL